MRCYLFKHIITSGLQKKLPLRRLLFFKTCSRNQTLFCCWPKLKRIEQTNSHHFLLPPSDQHCYTTGNAEMYQGHVAQTESGKTCQHWSSQWPHSHTYGDWPKDFPADNGRFPDNFCRAPTDDTVPSPWCYTVANTRWEKCNISICDDHLTCSVDVPPTNGKSSTDKTTVTAGSVVTYSCNAGYSSASGNTDRTCMKNYGKLSGEPLVCIEQIQG